jgi:hypothetical protein
MSRRSPSQIPVEFEYAALIEREGFKPTTPSNVCFPEKSRSVSSGVVRRLRRKIRSPGLSRAYFDARLILRREEDEKTAAFWRSFALESTARLGWVAERERFELSVRFTPLPKRPLITIESLHRSQPRRFYAATFLLPLPRAILLARSSTAKALENISFSRALSGCGDRI